MTTLTQYTKKFVHYLRHNHAVSALEYAILVGVIAVAIATALATFGGSIQTGMGVIGDKVKAPSATKTIDADG